MSEPTPPSGPWPGAQPPGADGRPNPAQPQPAYGPPQGYPPPPGYPPQAGYAPQPGAPAPGWGPPPGYAPVPADPALITGLPIEERSYSSFYRAPRWRWWKPIVALLLTAVAFLVLAIVFGVAGMLADNVDLGALAQQGMDSYKLGPWMFLANNVSLALFIPVVMLVQWLFFGQRPRWLSSVAGRFRWGWFGTCVAIALPIWLAQVGIELALTGVPPDLSLRPHTALMIVGILLTTPFQAAGEEYAMRGFEQRLVASYFRSDVVGFVVAAVLSSLTFMWLHSAQDPWLNLYYFAMGMVAAWITWRTGGLEAAVAIHVVNNMVAEALMPFSDFSDLFDRSVGVANAFILINVAVLVGATAIIWWVARRRRLLTRAAPGRDELARVQAYGQTAWGRP